MWTRLDYVVALIFTHTTCQYKDLDHSIRHCLYVTKSSLAHATRQSNSRHVQPLKFLENTYWGLRPCSNCGCDHKIASLIILEYRNELSSYLLLQEGLVLSPCKLNNFAKIFRDITKLGKKKRILDIEEWIEVLCIVKIQKEHEKIWHCRMHCVLLRRSLTSISFATLLIEGSIPLLSQCIFS